MYKKEAEELVSGLICEFNDWDEKKKYAWGYLEAVDKAEIFKGLKNRLNNYLERGGLFNPELMEHEKVRNLLVDCRDAFAKWEKIR